jgi:pilin isopeptide linkage protein
MAVVVAVLLAIPFTFVQVQNQWAQAATGGTVNTSATTDAGPVSGITVEIDDAALSGTYTFAGGDIPSNGTEPNVTAAVNDGTFKEAYVIVGGDSSKRYPISYLASKGNEVYYKVKGAEDALDKNTSITTDKTTGVTVASVLGENDQILFSYKSKESARHTLSYNFQLMSDNVDVLGGHASLISGREEIINNQILYFQIKRCPGTTITITPVNADGAVNGKVTRVEYSSDSMLETWKLEGTTGDVTLNIKESWTKTTYNATIKTKTPNLTDTRAKGYFGVAGALINGTTRYGLTGYSNQSVSWYLYKTGVKQLSVDASRTSQVPKNTTVEGTTIKFDYISNRLLWEQNITYNNLSIREHLYEITVNGEAVSLPPIGNVVGNSVTTLKQGEAAGTKVTVYWSNIEASMEEKDWNRVSLPVYSVLLENVHCDVDVQLHYCVVGSQRVYTCEEAVGVNAEIYFTPDSGVAQWGAFTAGSSSLGKWLSGNKVQLRWKDKPGYYNSKAIVSQYVLDSSGNVTSSRNETYSGLPLDSDGYHRASFANTSSNEYELDVTLTATPVKYQVTYDSNGGSYDEGTEPTDSKTYGVETVKSIIVDHSRPTKENYLFLGYKIKGDLNGVIYQPDEIIDVSSGVSDLSGLVISTLNDTAVIELEAQWYGIFPDDVLKEAKVLIKKRQTDGTYKEIESTYALVAEGGTFKVTDYKETLKASEDGTSGDDLKIDVANSTFEGVQGADTLPTLYYEKSAQIKFDYGVDSEEDKKKITGDLPEAQEGFGFSKVTVNVEDSTLRRWGYEIVGWEDKTNNLKYETTKNFTIDELPYGGVTLSPIWKMKDATVKVTAKDTINGRTFGAGTNVDKFTYTIEAVKAVSLDSGKDLLEGKTTIDELLAEDNSANGGGESNTPSDGDTTDPNNAAPIADDPDQTDSSQTGSGDGGSASKVPSSQPNLADTNVTKTLSGAYSIESELGTIEFKEVGVYIYKVTEKPESSDGNGTEYQWTESGTKNSSQYLIVGVFENGTPDNLSADWLEMPSWFHKYSAIAADAKAPTIKKEFKGRSVSDTEKLTFDFTLKADSTTAVLGNGSTLAASNMPMPANASNGKVTTTVTVTDKSSTPDGVSSGEGGFGNIEMKYPGTYTYKVTEALPTLDNTYPGVSYNEEQATYYVTYTVTDDYQGKLTVGTPTIKKTVVGSDTEETVQSITFLNHFDANAVTVPVTGLVTLTGRPIFNEEFEFQLKSIVDTDSNGVTTTIDAASMTSDTQYLLPSMFEGKFDTIVKSEGEGGNQADVLAGSIKFTLDDVGHTYTYYFDQIDMGAGGVTYDRTTHSVSLKISAALDSGITTNALTSSSSSAKSNETSQGAVEVAEEATEVTEEATVEADVANSAETTASEQADESTTTETAEGNEADVAEGVIETFAEEVNDTPAPAAQTASVSTAATEQKTTAREGVAQAQADTTSAAQVNVVATIVAIDDEPTDEGILTFNNVYEADPATLSVTAQKIYYDVSGKKAALTDGQFSFTLTETTEGVDSPVSLKATNKDDGSVVFGDVTFTQAGIHEYTVQEVYAGGNVVYDTEKYRITTQVVDDNQGGLVLVNETVRLSDDEVVDEIVFSNYEVEAAGSASAAGSTSGSGSDSSSSGSKGSSDGTSISKSGSGLSATGDSNNFALLFAVLLASGVLAVALLIRRKNNN